MALLQFVGRGQADKNIVIFIRAFYLDPFLYQRIQLIDQILAIRATGKTNMFDVKAVFELALEMGFNELADFVFTDTKAYSSFILTGKRL